MLDRIIASIALALVSYLERRIREGSTAVDGTVDRGRLSRAGSNIRRWLHKNDLSAGSIPDKDRPDGEGTNLHS